MHLGHTRVGLDAPNQHVNWLGQSTPGIDSRLSTFPLFKTAHLLCFKVQHSAMTKTKCVFQVRPLLLRPVLLLAA